MKKIIGVLLFLTLVFTLAACGETSAPVLNGANDVEVAFGVAFDPKKGVTATDEKDGDLTADIVITGEVNVNKAGAYVLTYTVENKAKKEAKKVRTVTVLPEGTNIEEPLGIITNGNFANGQEGWEKWFNDSQDVDAEYSFAGGKATIDIKAQSIIMDNNWWDVQLSQKTLKLDRLKSYTLKFTVSAENARKMMVNLQGGGLTEKAIGDELISVTKEEQEITIDFFAKEDAVNAELQFGLGSFHKEEGVDEAQHVVLGKVYISNVRIVEGPALENQAPIISAKNVILRPGTEQFLIKQGVTVSDDRDPLTLNDVVVEDITDGDAFATPAVKGVYQIKYTVEDSAGLTAEAIRTIVVANPFDLGDFSQDVADGVPTGWETWGEDNRGGISGSTAEGIVTLDITKIGDGTDLGHPWENQFKATDLATFKGVYTLSFTVKADKARPVKLGIEGGGGVDIPNISKMVDITTEWVTHTIEMNVEANAIYANRSVQFWFGNLADEEGYDETANVLTKVYFKDVVVNEGANVNSNWVDHEDGTNTITQDGTKVVVDYDKGEGQDWTTMSQTFEGENALFNTFTIHMTGAESKQVLVKINNSIEAWVTFDAEGKGSAIVTAENISSVHLFAEGGVAPVTGQYIIESATLTYIKPNIEDVEVDVNSNWVDHEDGTNTITQDGTNVVVDYVKVAGQEWTTMFQTFEGENALFNTFTIHMTGAESKKVLVKINNSIEEWITFDAEGKGSAVVTAANVVSVHLFAEGGVAPVTGQYIIESATLTYVKPQAGDPIVDVNDVWTDGGDGVYTVTNEADESVKVVYDKGDKSYAALKQNFTDHPGYKTLTLELTGTAGKEIIVKPNDDNTFEERLTFDVDGKISYTKTIPSFQSIILMVEPGSTDVTGEFTIVSAVLSHE